MTLITENAKNIAKEKLAELIQRYNATIRLVDHSNVSEETIRTWLNEFLEIFGWNVQNTTQVLQEYVLRGAQYQRLREIKSPHRRPDYTLLNGTNIKTFLDAKSLDVDIFTDAEAAYQIRSYGWSAQSPCAFVSNFEQLVIFDTRFVPNPDQTADASVKQFHIDEYLEKFDVIIDHLWHDNICNNHLEELYATTAVEGKNRVDTQFMNILANFRKELAINLYTNNSGIIATDSKRLERSLGTLGGGNHFIEVDVDENDGKYLVIHSGSRNLGTQVAEFYQQIAVDLNVGKEEYFRQREEIIRTYKEQGRRTEIQATIKSLEKEFKAKEPTLPRDLCFLYGSFMEDYLHDVDICQKFAERNRAKMAEIILERLGWTAVETFQTIHNYIDVNEMILRKGAVSAKAGEKLLIPINMRDGSLICIGKGNEYWNCSAPHGAGRLMSRSTAFERLTMAEYEAEMAGIYSTCVVPDTLDESPMAYKSMDEIVENIKPTAEIICRIKPIYNFKAAE